MYGIGIFVFVLVILIKLFNVFNKPTQSAFHSANAKFIDEILKVAPKLSEPYIPSTLWGYSGHIQTIIEELTNFFPNPLLNGERFTFITNDGATISYDFYQFRSKIKSEKDITLAVAPGACSSSETPNVRRLVNNAQLNGYNIAVLNHVGVLKCVPLTSPRIFNFGDTSDYDGMVHDIIKRHATTKIICIGYSLGGNIITKYLGERKSIPQIIAGISVCQGYDGYEWLHVLNEWENFRKFYTYAMTRKYLAIFHQWYNQLFSDEIISKGIEKEEICCAETLIELHENYHRKRYRYDSLKSMCMDLSCCTYWANITVPIVFIHSNDDPNVPKKQVDKVKLFVNGENTSEINNQFGSCKKERLLIEQKYGGHLGFYEGGFWNPNPLTWLDRTVITLADSLGSYVKLNEYNCGSLN